MDKGEHPRFGSGPPDPTTIYGGQGGGSSPRTPTYTIGGGGAQLARTSAPPMYGGGGGPSATTPMHGGASALHPIDMTNPLRQGNPPRGGRRSPMEHWETTWAQEVVTTARERGLATLGNIQQTNYNHARAIVRSGSVFRRAAAAAQNDEDEEESSSEQESSSEEEEEQHAEEDDEEVDVVAQEEEDDDAEAKKGGTRLSYTGEMGNARRLAVVNAILEQTVVGDGGLQRTAFHRGARTACVIEAREALLRTPPTFNGTPLFQNLSGLTVPQMQNVFATTLKQAEDFVSRAGHPAAGGDNGGSAALNTGPLAELYLRMVRLKQEVSLKTQNAKKKRARDSKIRERREKLALLRADERKKKDKTKTKRAGKKNMLSSSSEDEEEDTDDEAGASSSKGKGSKRNKRAKKMTFPKTPAKEAADKFDEMMANMDEQLSRSVAMQEAAGAAARGEGWSERVENLPKKLKELQDLLDSGVITPEEYATLRANVLQKLV